MARDLACALFFVALALLIPIGRFLCNCQNFWQLHRNRPIGIRNCNHHSKDYVVRQDGGQRLPGAALAPILSKRFFTISTGALTGVTRHMKPLETELEAVEGISLQQLDQPVVVGSW